MSDSDGDARLPAEARARKLTDAQRTQEDWAVQDEVLDYLPCDTTGAGRLSASSSDSSHRPRWKRRRPAEAKHSGHFGN